MGSSGMTVTGWIFLVVAWVTILGLSCWCMAKVLFGGRDK